MIVGDIAVEKLYLFLEGFGHWFLENKWTNPMSILVFIFRTLSFLFVIFHIEYDKSNSSIIVLRTVNFDRFDVSKNVGGLRFLLLTIL